MKKLLLAFTLAGASVAFANPALTPEQQHLLTFAHKVAMRDGHPPKYVQGILLTESDAGMNPTMNKKKKYFGVGQIKLVAAKEVLETYPYLEKKYSVKTDSAIVRALKTNPYFSTEVLSKYLVIIEERYGHTGNRLLEAYNQGPVAVKRATSFPYVIAMRKKLKQYGPLPS